MPNYGDYATQLGGLHYYDANAIAYGYATNANNVTMMVSWDHSYPMVNPYPMVANVQYYVDGTGNQYPVYAVFDTVYQYPDYQGQVYNNQINVTRVSDDYAKAIKKAERLLLMMLNDKQKQQYKEHGYFETEVNDRVYRIKKGYSGNVELLDKGKPKARFCIHTVDYLPDPDTMLAQLLMLRTNEKKFLEVANRTELYW